MKNPPAARPGGLRAVRGLCVGVVPEDEHPKGLSPEGTVQAQAVRVIYDSFADIACWVMAAVAQPERA